jgi:hypothetical protein
MTIRNMAQRVLASVAGAAAGSVVTWMAMDNDMLRRKKQFEAALKEKDDQIAALESKVADQPLITMAISTIAIGAITVLKAVTAGR